MFLSKIVCEITLSSHPISGPDVFLETGKVVGQNSTRMAGQVIVGVSAAFLVWDVVDLGWTVSDLIRFGIIVKASKLCDAHSCC